VLHSLHALSWRVKLSQVKTLFKLNLVQNEIKWNMSNCSGVILILRRIIKLNKDGSWSEELSSIWQKVIVWRKWRIKICQRSISKCDYWFFSNCNFWMDLTCHFWKCIAASKEKITSQSISSRFWLYKHRHHSHLCISYLCWKKYIWMNIRKRLQLNSNHGQSSESHALWLICSTSLVHENEK
jgi:hypothetical protein